MLVRAARILMRAAVWTHRKVRAQCGRIDPSAGRTQLFSFRHMFRILDITLSYELSFQRMATFWKANEKIYNFYEGSKSKFGIENLVRSVVTEVRPAARLKKAVSLFLESQIMPGWQS